MRLAHIEFSVITINRHLTHCRHVNHHCLPTCSGRLRSSCCRSTRICPRSHAHANMSRSLSQLYAYLVCMLLCLPTSFNCHCHFIMPSVFHHYAINAHESLKDAVALRLIFSLRAVKSSSISGQVSQAFSRALQVTVTFPPAILVTIVRHHPSSQFNNRPTARHTDARLMSGWITMLFWLIRPAITPPLRPFNLHQCLQALRETLNINQSDHFITFWRHWSPSRYAIIE